LCSQNNLLQRTVFKNLYCASMAGSGRHLTGLINRHWFLVFYPMPHDRRMRILVLHHIRHNREVVKELYCFAIGQFRQQSKHPLLPILLFCHLELASTLLLSLVINGLQGMASFIA
jgi:hypothetical protein